MENKEIKDKTLKELMQSSYKLTEKVLSDLKYAFIRDYTDERACRYAGISHETFYVWLRESEEFALEINRAKDSLLNNANDIITSSVLDQKDLDSAKYVTERRDKRRYSLRSELTGEDGKPLNPISSLEDQELAEVIKKYNLEKAEKERSSKNRENASDSLLENIIKKSDNLAI
jgi:hypothetical protein